MTKNAEHNIWATSISIHTPTQGVTDTGFKTSPWYPDFNPHSHAGSDYTVFNDRTYVLHFNPHSHAGSDTIALSLFNMQRISIHTPTQGVTLFPVTIQNIHSISIHTPTQGVTITHLTSSRMSGYFNPHSHAGSDNKRRFNSTNSADFNPHSHAGSDCSGSFYNSRLNRFQSTLPRREWLQFRPVYCSHLCISIHTPTQGVTQTLQQP